MKNLDRPLGRAGLMVVIWLGAAVALAQAPGAEWRGGPVLRARLEPLLEKLPPRTQLGFSVLDTASGAAVFGFHEDELLKPASVQKLFCTSAAIERFGPDFQFETRFYVSGGELWVLGGGDPGLGDPRILARQGRTLDWFFDELAQRLRTAGPEQRFEKIVLDDSLFDQEWRNSGWPVDQAQAWYQAPVGALNINDNCLDARVRVSKADIQLALSPPLTSDFVREQLRLGDKHQPAVKRGFESDIFEFVGAVNRNDSVGPICAKRPTLFFGSAIKAALEQRGWSSGGQIVRRKLMPQALASVRPVWVHTTSLRDVLWRCNTHSQNLFAECLLKSLAAYGPNGQRGAGVGDWEGGVRVLRETLGGLGVPLSSAKFQDGSGLSHENRVSARQIATLLSVMSHRPGGAVLRESMAVAGDDEGTMRRRYATKALAGRLRGKTGTIAGVSAVAGYLSRDDGVTLSFALLINGQAPSGLAERLLEALLTPV